MFAYHIDLGVAMWKKDLLVDYVNRLKACGYTNILLEIQDKFRFSGHPTMAHPDALSPEEWREVFAAWRECGMGIIPLWQTLGHASLILDKPAYAHLREQPSSRDQFCPGSPLVTQLLLDWIDELIEVIQPAAFFHIGGDETWNLGKSERLKPLVDEIGIGGLYVRHMKPILEHLIGKGLRPVVWADMLLTHPEILPEIPPEVVMMDWDYTTGSDRNSRIRPWGMNYNWVEDLSAVPEGPVRVLLQKYAVDERTGEDATFRGFFYADALADMGFDVITASANRCWGDSTGTPYTELHLPNVFYSARKGKVHFGNTVTSWALRHNHPETHWPVNAVAAMAWRTDQPFNMQELLNQFCLEHYGVDEPGYAAAILAGGRTWFEAQASSMNSRLDSFAAGKDPFEADWKELAHEDGLRESAKPRLLALRKDAAAARDCLMSIKVRAKTHAHEFDYWLEGIDYNLLHIDCLLAALEGVTPERRSELDACLDACRETTRRLFEKSYAPGSIDAELAIRYGFLEVWLKAYP